MLSNPQSTAGEYVTDFLAMIRNVEAHIARPYYDRATRNNAGEYQNVTIGDGINIDWSNTIHLKLVLAQLGLVASSTQVEANRRLLAGEPPEDATERAARLDAMVTAFRQVMIDNRQAINDQTVALENDALRLQMRVK